MWEKGRGRSGSQDSREVTLNNAQLTPLSWHAAAEGREENGTVWEHHEMKRTHKPVQFFLLHTESLSNSACSCGRWNITISHPSLGLISSLADSIERKAKAQAEGVTSSHSCRILLSKEILGCPCLWNCPLFPELRTGSRLNVTPFSSTNIHCYQKSGIHYFAPFDLIQTVETTA